VAHDSIFFAEGMDILIMGNAGAWIGIILLICAGIVFGETISYEYYGTIGPGPGMFPVWVSGILIILSSIFIIQSFFKNKLFFKDILPTGTGLKKVLGLIGALILFVVAVPFTSYLIAGVTMMFILFSFDFRWYSSLLLSFALNLAIFYVFKQLLGIPLPVTNFGF
jgi:putative tricarboxylic transport membrane protein